MYAATADHPALDLADFNTSGNDAWKATTTGTTNFLVTAGQYRSVHVIVSSGGAGVGNNADFRIRLNYSDGSRDISSTYSAPDWFGDPPVAPMYYVQDGMDRFDGSYSNVGDPAIFGVGVAADFTKTLSSIDLIIDGVPSGGVFALFGGAATDDVIAGVAATTPSATAPGAPTGVSAQAGSQSAIVSFSPPASNGGAPITSYTVTASPGGATATGSGSPITVTGLTNGTSYTFTVTATNSAGTGSASSASSAVTPAVPVPTMEFWSLLVFALMLIGAAYRVRREIPISKT